MPRIAFWALLEAKIAPKPNENQCFLLSRLFDIGAVLGHLGSLLGPLGGLLAAFWRALGRFLGPLEALLGRSWGALGSLRGALGAILEEIDQRRWGRILALPL